MKEPTPIPGIHYYVPPADAVLTGRDGMVEIPYGDIPVPLLEEDYEKMEGGYPSYDAVGRGVYQALRSNPDCTFGERYARLLKDAYPHFLSELASHIIMLDNKDVDVSYLDRKVNYLKILALIEPGNPHFPEEIGVTLMERGLRLSALQFTTVTLYRAEGFLRRALELSFDSVTARLHLGEVSYLLGKYEQAASLWRGILTSLGHDESQNLVRRLQKIEEGVTPHIPVVDYLEAIGVAFDCQRRGEWEEAVALLHDVLDDGVFREEFPLPGIWYMLGICYRDMGMPRYAEEYLLEALKLDSDYAEAQVALHSLNA